MIRASLLAAAGLSLLVLPAEARPKPKAEAAPPSLQASPIGTFGDWNVFAAGEGKSRICYAISQPQVRLRRASSAIRPISSSPCARAKRSTTRSR